MSMNALLRGTVTYLSTQLNLDEKHLDVRVDGRPPAWAGGKYYYAIHPSSWAMGPSQGNSNVGIDELFGISITITLRIGRIPPSRRPREGYLKSSEGLEPRMRTLIRLMTQGRYTGILAAANSLLGNTDIIIEPLVWSGGDAAPNPVGPDWFTADSEDASSYGWTFSSEFSGARRIQYISSME